MGADVWVKCPVCHNRPEEHRDGIDHLYGKIPLGDFLKLKSEIEDRKSVETVRGDYEVGLNEDGTVYVHLYLKCQTCGVTWEFSKDDIKAR